MSSSPVLFLHSSMSSGQQWNALRESLNLPSVAPDIAGYGKAAMPSNNRSEHQLAFELERLSDQIPEQPFHLVGHSYGAASALRLARLHPEKVISLTLFEPVAFHLLGTDDPQQQSVLALSQKIENFIDQGDPASAATCFIDYWNGEGTFSRLNEKMQSIFCQGIIKVAYDFTALLNEDCQPGDLKTIHCPVLLLEGAESQPTTHAVMSTLRSVFPEAEHHNLPCGHMGPLTHPHLVNPLVSQFIATHNKAG